MKRVIHLLPIVLILASSSALAWWGGPGWGGPGWGNRGWGDGWLGTSGVAVEPDPVDSRTTSDDFPGAAEDRPGFGVWGPKDAGEKQPGNGRPSSGPRP